MFSPGAFRLFLATVVMVHHSFPLRLGGWAVGMFFVISGFWISRMWRTKYSRKPSPYRTFVASRWWRIAPLFVTTQLLAAFLVITGLLAGTAAIGDWRWWATQPTVLGSTQFGRLLPPSWSLDVEMQFYLLAPFLVPILVRNGQDSGNSPPCASESKTEDASLFRYLLVVSLLGWCVWRLTHGATMETPHWDVFAGLFVAGVVCDILEWRPSHRIAMASALGWGALILAVLSSQSTRNLVWLRGATDQAPESIAAALFFIASTIVAIPFAIWTVHRPSSGWDRWMGDLSFPLYLFHWIPRDWYYAHVGSSKSALQSGGLLLASFAVSFVGAIALLQFIDRPIQGFRQRWLSDRRTTESG